MPKRNLKKKYKKKYKTKNKGGTWWWKKKSSKTRVEKKKPSLPAPLPRRNPEKNKWTLEELHEQKTILEKILYLDLELYMNPYVGRKADNISEAEKKKIEGQIAEITAQMTPMVQALRKSVRAEANRRPKPLRPLDESIYAKDYSNIHSHPATARRSRDWRRHGSVPRPHHNSPDRSTAQIVKKTPSKIPTQSTKKTLRSPSKILTQRARKAFKKAESTTRVPKKVLQIPSKVPTQHRDFSSHINRKLAKKTFKSVARSATRAPETALRIASELPTADIPDISLGDIGDAFSGISNIFQ